MQLLVDRLGALLIGVELDPDLLEAVVVLTPAQCARTVAGGERGRLVEEEQLREPARLHQRRTVPVAEPKPAGDPQLAVVVAADLAAVVMEAAAIAVHEAAFGVASRSPRGVTRFWRGTAAYSTGCPFAVSFTSTLPRVAFEYGQT